MSSIGLARSQKPLFPEELPQRVVPDAWMLSGLMLGALAVVGGIAMSGAGLTYFFQPASALIVLGGTFGVTLVTLPRDALRMIGRRIQEMIASPKPEREALIEKIAELCRIARRDGMVGVEPLIPQITNAVLRSGLQTALDVRDVSELQSVLENELKLCERHGQADAHALESAAGYAPTIGILGTVVGLIDVLKHFSDIRAVGPGIGAAFVSTIYGLAVANFLLLPLAHRIQARVAEQTETQELIAEGVVCIFASMHPSIARQRLAPYLREASERARILNFRPPREVLKTHASRT